MNKIIQTLGISIILATITIVSADIWLSKAALATTEEEDNSIVSTEIKTIDGKQYEVTTYSDGTQRMKNLETGFCSHANPEAGTTYGSDTCDTKHLKPGSGVIMSSPDDQTYDLPPYGEGGAVENDMIEGAGD